MKYGYKALGGVHRMKESGKTPEATVIRKGTHYFHVPSEKGDKEYRTTATTCTCKAGKYNAMRTDGKDFPCKHRILVQQELKKQS